MKLSRLLIQASLAALCLPAGAQDFSWSGYGTLGYARSNRDFTYQRDLTNDGTLERDSLLGVQGDLRFSPQWSATVQLKLAPSIKAEDQWDLVPAWAFVAWRPSDNWLLRAGRMRVPLYLHSESMDVGVTHDMARLPTEMYSIAPSTDFNGASVAKSWPLDDGELSLDVYSGRIGTTARLWMRDGAPPRVNAGANFVDVDVHLSGAMLTLRTVDGRWSGGMHRTTTRQSDGSPLPVRFPFVPVGMGLGYYQVSDQQPGPGVPVVSHISNTIYTLGVEQQLAPGWRLAVEFARDVQRDTDMGSDTRGGYVALFHQIGRTTPYLSYGLLRSAASSLDWYRNLTQNLLPPTIPGADQLNAAQRVAAEGLYATDQHSFAVGASHAIGNSQKVKIEWMRTHIGQASRLVDTPAGRETPHNTAVDVWSLNYSFSF